MKVTIRFPMITILILLSGFAQAAEKNTASEQSSYCAAGQLEIRQLAIDAPGMMKTRAFFVVLNHGSNPCTLRAGSGLLWSNNKTPSQYSEEAQTNSHDPDSGDPDSNKRYILLPVPADGKMALKDLFGFSVWNNGASGTGEALFSSISVQLPNAKGHRADRVYDVAYQGYATSPIPKKRFGLIPFLAWSVFESDDCQTTIDTKPLVGVDAKGSNIPERTVDVRQMLQCG